MAERIYSLLFAVIIFGGIGLAISYFVPHEGGASQNLPKPPPDASIQEEVSGTELGGILVGLLALAAVAIHWIIGITLSVACLVFMYGIVVLVFRHAFGIELPFGRFN